MLRESGLLQIGHNLKNDNDLVVVANMASWSVFSNDVVFPLSNWVSGSSFMMFQWVRDTKFGMKVSNEKKINAAKCQVYS